jgi:hypothetical protein
VFITQRVFDPELVGCAVYIGGTTSGGIKYNQVYLVKEAKGETLSLVDFKGGYTYATIKDFNNYLKMDILERPQAIPERVQKQPEQLEMVQVIQDIPRNKKVMAKERNIRTTEQIRAEEKEIELFLQKSEGRPIRLEKIVHIAKAQGWNWNNKNASSFMRSAIKNGAQIKKVGYGTYAFAAEVQA